MTRQVITLDKVRKCHVVESGDAAGTFTYESETEYESDDEDEEELDDPTEEELEAISNGDIEGDEI